MLRSKLREAWICIKAGRVTLSYPAAPRLPARGFRGKIRVRPDLCFGCGGCANVCPAGVIAVNDPDPQTRVLEFSWGRCTYCGRCEEVCPEQAIRLGTEFETATNRASDLFIRIEVLMGPCQRCGRCFVPPTPLERLSKRGFRHDPPGARP